MKLERASAPQHSTAASKVERPLCHAVHGRYASLYPSKKLEQEENPSKLAFPAIDFLVQARPSLLFILLLASKEPTAGILESRAFDVFVVRGDSVRENACRSLRTKENRMSRRTTAQYLC